MTVTMKERRRTHKYYPLFLATHPMLTSFVLCLLCPKAVITVEESKKNRSTTSAPELQRVEYPDCVLPNWDTAFCRWCEGNETGVEWEVKYRIGKKGKWVSCRNRTNCTCTLPTHISIRHMVTFNISASNTSEIFEVNCTDQSLIVPNPVDKLKVIRTDSRSMKVIFKEPDSLALVSLTFHITMESKFDKKIKILGATHSKTGRHSVVFNDLIPYTNYSTSVKMRPAVGTYWSKIVTEYKKTLPDAPARNPETRPSSFQYHRCPGDCRTLTLYYKDIPERYTQGNITGMRATFRDDNTNQTYIRVCSFNEDRKCELDNAPLTSDFSVEITGSTAIGFGPRVPTSVMSIPEYHAGSNVPEHLAGEIQNETDKKAVTLFEWSYDGETPDAFVLYYRRMLQDVAQGGLSWFVLDGTQNRAEVVIEHGRSGLKNYQFAVAAEKRGQSAGMSKQFLKCLYKMDGEKPIIQALLFKSTHQDQNSLKVVLPPQQCKPRHRQIVNIIVTVQEVTTEGKIKQGGFNKIEKIPAPRVPQKYTVPALKDSTFYNISLTAVCRDGSDCQHLTGVTLETKPPLSYVFPAWVYGVIILILALVLLATIGMYWFYRRTTSKKKRLQIQRTPAVIQALEGNDGTTDEYYAIMIDNTQRPERSESESSSGHCDHSSRELTQLIPTVSGGSCYTNMGDGTSLLSASASDGTFGRSPGLLNPTSHQPSLQPVPEADENIINYPNGDVFMEIVDERERGRFVANNQLPWQSSRTAPAHVLPVLNLEAPYDPDVILKGTSARKRDDSPSSDLGSASSEDSVDDYVKLASLQRCFDPGPSDTESEGHPAPNILNDVDDAGHSKLH
ncbi:uncharacterized protein LOC135486984 isoform X2 [Lineus longissimus]|uniref:uncharacterized protein LOC135486984 isoform X2 n=1 Tax=Lineus longissimus TaxID=88925 RepID=UPI00315D5E4B